MKFYVNISTMEVCLPICKFSVLDRCVPIDSFLSGNQELIDISQQHAVDNNNDNITSNDLGIAIR